MISFVEESKVRNYPLNLIVVDPNCFISSNFFSEPSIFAGLWK